MTIDKDKMAEGYIQMGEINLNISKECFVAESECLKYHGGGQTK